MSDRTRLFFLSLGHGYDHMFMLLFPTAVLALEDEFKRPYGELLSLATPGFIAFAVGTLPAGWLGDRWSRPGMIAVFFIGIGIASCLTGLARTPLEIAAGLTLVGLFASIYHPVGIAMLVEGREKVGKLLGINGVAGNLGLAAAALVAATLADAWSWRAVFILPGIVSIGTGILFVAAYRRAPPVPVATNRAARRPRVRLSPMMRRLIVVMTAATVLTGIIFNVSTIALPKVFDEGLHGLVTSTTGIGTLVSAVIAIAAFAQIGVGVMMDRYPAKPIWIAVLLAQVPLLLLVGVLADYGLVLVALAMMIFIIGEIPVQDVLIARYAADAWRARVYGLKFLVSLGVGATAAPLVAGMHGLTGGFFWLFVLLAGCAAAIAVIAFWLPERAARAAVAMP